MKKFSKFKLFNFLKLVHRIFKSVRLLKLNIFNKYDTKETHQYLFDVLFIGSIMKYVLFRTISFGIIISSVKVKKD